MAISTEDTFLDDLEQKFLDNYYYACVMFGVASNTFERSMELHYLTQRQYFKIHVYHIANYPSNFPEHIKKPKTTVSSMRDEDAIRFMMDFNDIVDEIKFESDDECLLMLLKYDYLRHRNKQHGFEVDQTQLFNLN